MLGPAKVCIFANNNNRQEHYFVKFCKPFVALLAAALVSGCVGSLRDFVCATWHVENRSQHTLVYRYSFGSCNNYHIVEPGATPHVIVRDYSYPYKLPQSSYSFEDMLALTGQSDIPAGERFFQVFIEGQTVPLKTWYGDKADGDRYFFDESQWKYDFSENSRRPMEQTWRFIITEEDIGRWTEQ